MAHEIARRLVDSVWRTGAVVEDSGGGGDSSGLEVIGPFRITPATPELATGATLASLSDGQIVIMAWAINIEGFDGGGFLNIGVYADPGRDDVATLSKTTAQGAPAGLFPAVLLNAVFSTAVLVVGAGTLKALDETSPTVGISDVYALVWTPPA